MLYRKREFVLYTKEQWLLPSPRAPKLGNILQSNSENRKKGTRKKNKRKKKKQLRRKENNRKKEKAQQQMSDCRIKEGGRGDRLFVLLISCKNVIRACSGRELRVENRGRERGQPINRSESPFLLLLLPYFHLSDFKPPLAAIRRGLRFYHWWQPLQIRGPTLPNEKYVISFSRNFVHLYSLLFQFFSPLFLSIYLSVSFGNKIQLPTPLPSPPPALLDRENER